jgi:molybdopterin-containing oxidoreductase family membrane subunit
MYYPTWTEWGIMIGVFGIFFTLFLLFTRLLPVIAIAEVKSIMKVSSDEAKEKLNTQPVGELNVNLVHSPENQQFK